MQANIERIINHLTNKSAIILYLKKFSEKETRRNSLKEINMK